METFAAALPASCRRAHRHLDGSEPSQDFTSALAFVMLDHGVFRIVSERYLDDNGSHGLTTIDKEHTLLNRSGTVAAAALATVDLFEDGIVIDRPKRLVVPGARLSPTVERQVLDLLVSTPWARVVRKGC